MTYEIIETTSQDLANVTVFGIRCICQGRSLAVINDVSDHRELVETMIYLFRLGKLHPYNLNEAIESILGMVV